MSTLSRLFRWGFGSSGAAHSVIEDIVAMCIGALLVSVGLALYQSAGLLTGGMAGVAFLVHYATGWPLGKVFFVLNLPFYWLAVQHMGRAMLAKTIVGVTLVSIMASIGPALMTIEKIVSAYASIVGGAMLGAGFLILFRHRASLGGFGILVLYLQERFGWSAGKIQMGIDCAIVVCALWVVPIDAVIWSVLSAILLNLVLIMNYRKDRYLGT